MRGEWFGWGGSVAVSVGIHIVVVALLLFEFGAPPPPIPPAAAPAPMVVELAPMPTAATAAASDTPDGPEQQEQEQANLPDPAEKPPPFDPPPQTRAAVPDALPVPPDAAPPAPQRAVQAISGQRSRDEPGRYDLRAVHDRPGRPRPVVATEAQSRFRVTRSGGVAADAARIAAAGAATDNGWHDDRDDRADRILSALACGAAVIEPAGECRGVSGGCAAI